MPVDARELSDIAANKVMACTPEAIVSVNNFTQKTFQTRGGRIGSGMGSLIEGLWGFYLNAILRRDPSSQYELGWIYGHEYNDFACIVKGEEWKIATREGELFRVEVKSMVRSADESKAHFDRLVHELPPNEVLAVFLWDWCPVPGSYNVSPAIIDHFVGPALPIAELRDKLHLLRGGHFVIEDECPDGCVREACVHLYEPLNAKGVRERRTGPATAVSGKVQYAANFGGMLRMLGTRSAEGRAVLSAAREESHTQREFIDFMARNFSRVEKAIR